MASRAISKAQEVKGSTRVISRPQTKGQSSVRGEGCSTTEAQSEGFVQVRILIHVCLVSSFLPSECHHMYPNHEIKNGEYSALNVFRVVFIAIMNANWTEINMKHLNLCVSHPFSSHPNPISTRAFNFCRNILGLHGLLV